MTSETVLLQKDGTVRMLSLEKLTQERIPLLIKTRQRVWDATYRGIYPDEAIDQFDFLWHEQAESRRLKNPEYHCFLLMDEENCAGYIAFGNVFPAREDAPSFRLHSLYLLPDYQGAGLGRKLFDMTKVACRAAGKNRFSLDCHPDNKPALGFYTHMGGCVAKVGPRHENPMEDSCTFEFYID